MHLDPYMTQNNIKNVDMAHALGFTESFISKLRKKKAIPNLLNALLICKYCDHEVTILDLITQELMDQHTKKRQVPLIGLNFLSRHYPVRRENQN